MYSVSIDVPDLEAGISFYTEVFDCEESARPVKGYAVLKVGEQSIGIMEKDSGTSPAPDSEDLRRYSRHWTPVHIDFHVDDFTDCVERTEQAGGKCEQRFEGGDHPPVAFCSDPFGNGFCIIGQR